jgi:Fic family protein
LVSAEGAWERWIEFCLRGTVEQARDSIRRCEKLHALREKFHRKNTKGLARSYAIIERLFSSPVLTVPEIMREHGVTYPTAKSDIQALIDLGILRELPEMRPKAFYSPEIFSIAYGEDGNAEGV